MRIETSKHSSDRGVDEVLVLDLDTVKLARLLEQLGVQPESIPGLLVEREKALARESTHQNRDQKE